MSAVGKSPPVVLNLTNGYTPYFGPAPAWAVGLIVTVSPGASLTYTVEVTADQVPSSSGNWNSHDVLAAQTASANGNIAYPVTAIRLNVTAYSSGSVNLGVATWP